MYSKKLLGLFVLFSALLGFCTLLGANPINLPFEEIRQIHSNLQ